MPSMITKESNVGFLRITNYTNEKIDIRKNGISWISIPSQRSILIKDLGFEAIDLEGWLSDTLISKVRISCHPDVEVNWHIGEPISQGLGIPPICVKNYSDETILIYVDHQMRDKILPGESISISHNVEGVFCIEAKKENGFVISTIQRFLSPSVEQNWIVTGGVKAGAIVFVNNKTGMRLRVVLDSDIEKIIEPNSSQSFVGVPSGFHVLTAFGIPYEKSDEKIIDKMEAFLEVFQSYDWDIEIFDIQK